MEETEYLVVGEFKGKEIKENISAYSVKQAKMKGGFSAGIGGQEISEFMKSSKIRVVRK